MNPPSMKIAAVGAACAAVALNAAQVRHAAKLRIRADAANAASRRY